MSQHTIEIPHPVVTVEVDTSFDVHWTMTYKAYVEVGGYVVFERTYTDDKDQYGEPDFAESEHDARDKVLVAFGKRLKSLLEGSE